MHNDISQCVACQVAIRERTASPTERERGGDVDVVDVAHGERTSGRARRHPPTWRRRGSDPAQHVVAPDAFTAFHAQAEERAVQAQATEVQRRAAERPRPRRGGRRRPRPRATAPARAALAAVAVVGGREQRLGDVERSGRRALEHRRRRSPRRRGPCAFGGADGADIDRQLRGQPGADGRGPATCGPSRARPTVAALAEAVDLGRLSPTVARAASRGRAARSPPCRRRPASARRRPSASKRQVEAALLAAERDAPALAAACRSSSTTPAALTASQRPGVHRDAALGPRPRPSRGRRTAAPGR